MFIFVLQDNGVTLLSQDEGSVSFRAKNNHGVSDETSVKIELRKYKALVFREVDP